MKDSTKKMTSFTPGSKKFIKGVNVATATIVFGIVFGMFGTESKAEVNPRVLVNNEQVQFQDVLPVIRDSRTLIPLRGVFEKLGFDIQWDANANTATLRKGELNITLTIGDEAIVANGERKIFDVPPQIIQDRFMVPLRAISELSGARVDWIDEDKTVMITTDDGAVVVVPTVTPTPIVVEATPTPTPIVAVEGELPPGNLVLESKMTLNGVTFYLGETKESIESKFGKPLSVEHDNIIYDTDGSIIGGKNIYHYNGFEFQYSTTRMLTSVVVENIPFSKDGYYVGMPYDYPDRNLIGEERWNSGGGATYPGLSTTIRNSEGEFLYVVGLYGGGSVFYNISPETYYMINVYRSGTRDWARYKLVDPNEN